MCRRRRPPLLALWILALAFGLPARAQILSPGDLAAPHAEFDSLTSCTKCHGGSQRISPERCYACHLEVGRRAEDGRGLHGRLARKRCQDCHKDHRGKTATLIEWGGPKARFDHARTGWPLVGAHARARCEACHDRRRVHDADVKALLKRTRKRRTHLGLSRTCQSCHFDEHRGQVNLNCATCHTPTAFKPATHFDHGKTHFVLRGKHRQVKCAKCHRREEDTRTLATAFPAPKSPTFLRFAPVEHAACTSCHRDPHQSKFGARCTECHNNKGWKNLRAEMRDRDFHKKSKFPLLGAHASAPCAGCHGPFRGQRKARFKGIPFKTCEGCHPDGHQGQLSRVACERCHDVAGFKPVHFELAEHQKTPYPLEGGHRAAPCNGCHPKAPRRTARVSPKIARRMKRERRPLLQSSARLAVHRPPDGPRRCAGCHPDPHGGQFKKRLRAEGCEGCHQVTSFQTLRFDHETQTRFRRREAHLKATCEQCHFKTERRHGETVLIYRNGHLRCADCHTDVHLGQMDRRHPEGCKACHGERSFKDVRFDHNDPTMTDYPLDGKHKKVSCEACHPGVQVAGVTTRRYRPLPRSCEACHASQHRGKFDALFTAGAAKGAPSTGEARGCAVCHATSGWQGARFEHARTRWPLKGAHQAAACSGCHAQGFEAPLSRRCSACHQDSHLGRLGGTCEECHQETDWRSDYGPEAHRATAFPLTGRHALVPCRECHAESRERTFTAVERSCNACHQRDFLRTGLRTIDHTVAGFDTRCERCHTPSRFRGATFPEHDGCFLISRGSHGRLRCNECHSSLQGLRPTGACLTRNATCTGCHTHVQSRTDPLHTNVLGYQYRDRKCFECHRISG